MLKLVIFDLGSTLINYPMSLETAAKNFYRYETEIDLPPKVIKDWYQIYMAERKSGFQSLREATFLSALHGSLAKNDYILAERRSTKILWQLYQGFFRNMATVIDGAEKILKYARRRGLKIGLISNTAWPGIFHEKDMQNFGLLSYFDSICWSFEEKIRKPHSRLFQKQLETHHVSASEAVYIGDSFSRDVVGANGAGIKAIWVSMEMATASFDGWHARDLVEARAILKKIE